MRSAEIILGRFEDRRHLTPVATLVTPQSVSQTPVVYLPHPSRHPDAWHHGPDQAVRGHSAERQPGPRCSGPCSSGRSGCATSRPARGSPPPD